jgi:hypothetical protein
MCLRRLDLAKLESVEQPIGGRRKQINWAGLRAVARFHNSRRSILRLRFISVPSFAVLFPKLANLIVIKWGTKNMCPQVG